MAPLFLEEYPRFLAQIQEAIDKKDPSSLSYAAHTLKGSVGNFAASDAFEAAFALERFGRQGDLARASAALVDLEAALSLIETRFRQTDSGGAHIARHGRVCPHGLWCFSPSLHDWYCQQFAVFVGKCFSRLPDSLRE
jgi:HPt (histidine-containing phosphotransfer) domain-containing protein